MSKPAQDTPGNSSPREAPRTRFEPPQSEAGRPYWEATREQRLILPWCPACEQPHWFPRDACPFCLSPAIEWRPASGDATVYAVSVMPKPALPMMAGMVPYAVAIVELAEGVRMMTNIVEVDADEVAVGDRVQAAWEPLSDGRALLVFRIASS